MCTTIADNAKKGAGTDTIECRIGALSLVDEAPDSAADNRAVRCLEAGPYSASCAGSACAAWCHIVQSTCTGNNAQYPSQAECETACGAFPPAPPNILSGKMGNTLVCRFYHAEAASEPNAASYHCPHLAPLGKVTPCQ